LELLKRSAWVRSRRDDHESSPEAWRAPADDSPGDRQCDAAGPEEDGSGTTEAGAGPGTHRADAGSRRQAPRKQRHTGTGSGPGCGRNIPNVHRGADRTRYVGLRKRELGVNGRKVFVPQSYHWGQEAQVDWFEAVAKLAASGVSYSSSRCGAWRRETPFTGLTPTRRNKRFWKDTNTRSPTSTGLRHASLRQPGERGEEDSAGEAATGNRAHHRLPVALGFPERIL